MVYSFTYAQDICANHRKFFSQAVEACVIDGGIDSKGSLKVEFITKLPLDTTIACGKLCSKFSMILSLDLVAEGRNDHDSERLVCICNNKRWETQTKIYIYIYICGEEI